MPNKVKEKSVEEKKEKRLEKRKRPSGNVILVCKITLVDAHNPPENILQVFMICETKLLTLISRPRSMRCRCIRRSPCACGGNSHTSSVPAAA